jgi:hypothetical protein
MRPAIALAIFYGKQFHLLVKSVKMTICSAFPENGIQNTSIVTLQLDAAYQCMNASTVTVTHSQSSQTYNPTRADGLMGFHKLVSKVAQASS